MKSVLHGKMKSIALIESKDCLILFSSKSYLVITINKLCESK